MDAYLCGVGAVLVRVRVAVGVDERVRCTLEMKGSAVLGPHMRRRPSLRVDSIMHTEFPVLHLRMEH